jgi:hypothetical protein
MKKSWRRRRRRWKEGNVYSPRSWPPGVQTKKVSYPTHRSAHAVPVGLELIHARPPVVQRVGLGVLLAAALGVSALRQHVRHHDQPAEVNLQELERDGAGGRGERGRRG